MLKVEIDHGEKQIVIAGSLAETLEELGLLIRCIHVAIDQRDKKAAAKFREYVTLIVSDPASPLWTMDPSKYGDYHSFGMVIPMRGDDHGR